MMSNTLKLNQALLLVNKINITDPIQVHYQLEECFGCPPDKLTPHTTSDPLAVSNVQQEQFVIDTQHNFHLELRQLESNVTKSWCQLDDLAFNSYGQYRIDVSRSESAAGTLYANNSKAQQNQPLRCELTTIDSGECLLCPVAILICILLAIVAGEQIYAKFWPQNKRRQRTEHGGADGKLSSSTNEPNHPDCCDPGSGQNQNDTARGAQTLDLNDHNVSRCESSSDQTTGASGDRNNNNDNNTETDLSLGSKARASRRIECLDIFRGFTLAGMIFVNYGGAGYALLEHKAWDGLTLADLVFPFFIFSMGASVAIAARGLIRKYQKSFHLIALKIFRRALILALLGVFLNSKWLDYSQADGLRWLRVTGVLQRFSVSYLVIAFMYCIELKINEWTRAQSLSNVPYLSELIGIVFELMTAVNYGAIYIYLTFFFQFDSNCPVGYIGPGGQTEGGKYANCTGGSAAWIDRLLLGTDHMYNDREVKQVFKTQISHDPEGVLGYTTSILLTLIGLQCGKILINARTSHKQKILSLCQLAMVMAATSSLIVLIPINKRLWSLTFVTVTALAAFITIILLYVLVDVYSCKQSILLKLLSSAGKNSIFLYVGHSIVHEMLPFWFPVGPEATHLQLLLRLSWSTFVWLMIAHFMASKKLLIKV